MLLAESGAASEGCGTPPLPMQSRLWRSGAETATARLVTLVHVIERRQTNRPTRDGERVKAIARSG